MTTVLFAKGLRVGFGSKVVLADVDIALRAGEKLALVGANGSGKSTLLRTVAGLLPPLAGQVRWCGSGLPRGSERVKTVGVLLQNEKAAPFTVEQQVTMGLALDGAPSKASQRVIVRALDRNSLSPLRDRGGHQLSGGEAQRMRWARAGVAEPSILLLDEPTNHLDPARRADLMRQLTKLPPHTAVILSTHDLSVAANCDRVALLHAGRIILQGSADEVLQQGPLSQALGVAIQRVEDPQGREPFFRASFTEPSPAQSSGKPTSP